MRSYAATLQVLAFLYLICQGFGNLDNKTRGERDGKERFQLYKYFIITTSNEMESLPEESVQENEGMSERIGKVEPSTTNEEEGRPEVPVCMLDETDHHPKNLAHVLEHPREYIKGPLSKMKGPKKHYTIVGAGMSGLIAAYLLLSVGHKVTLFEADKRVGGRVYTRYENGYYGDLGAMRFYMYHLALQKALKIFDVKTASFTNRNDESEGKYYFLHGRYFLEEDLKNQTKLRELYDLYEITNIPKDKDGLIRNPKKVIGEMIENSIAKAVYCNQDIILHEFLRKTCKEQGIDPLIIMIFGDMSTITPFEAYSLRNIVKDSDEKAIAKAVGFADMPPIEIVNGSAQLPFAVVDKLQQFNEFTIHMNSPVYKIDNKNSRMKVYYGTDKSQETYHETEDVIIGTTAKAVLMIDFTKRLPPWKYTALMQLKYINSFKVFLKFKTPFWSKKDNNWAAPILFGEHPGKKSGGVGITNSRIVQIYYPSHAYHGNKLLASYSWDNQADFWLSFNESQTIDMVLEELGKIHGPVVRKQYEHGFVFNWITDPYSHGGFVWWEPYQRWNFHEHLREPFGNIRFVGEYTNKLYHGWVESAIESSIRLLVNEHPKLYKDHFEKDEIAFLNRRDRFQKK